MTEMKEIGGYFGLEEFHGSEYHEGLLGLNNGRNALAYLIRSRNIEKLYIPHFLCDSVSNVCQRERCEFAYYEINRDFLPVFQKQLGPGEWIYVVNFYGQISNAMAEDMKSRWPNMIFDNVQAFFQKPVAGIDTIYSCRKFFGVPDGGYLATDAPELALEQDVSKDRMKHVLGRIEGNASDYHGDFKANDHSFAELPVREMSALTRNLLRAVDYETVRERRNSNYEILAGALGQYNPLALRQPDGPYAYPFYCKDGMRVKKELAKKKIYVATLWPNVLELEGTLERDYAENILPLPCDQRYSPEDMYDMIKEILACINYENWNGRIFRPSIHGAISRN